MRSREMRAAKSDVKLITLASCGGAIDDNEALEVVAVVRIKMHLLQASLSLFLGL